MIENIPNYKLLLKYNNFDIVYAQYIDFDYNTLNRLRELTLENNSGMNLLLDLFEGLNINEVKADFYLSMWEGFIVGWSVATKEITYFFSHHSHKKYDPSYGYQFNVFISPSYRGFGLASKLLETARDNLPENEKLVVFPYDKISYKFYNKYLKDPKVIFW